MPRQIKITAIAAETRDNLSELIRAATLDAERRLKERTPVDTGRLRSNWQTTIQPFEGSVFNNLPYAAPVVAGIDLPPSWGGKYRTRQGAEPFLDIVAKDVQTRIGSEAIRISTRS